MWFRNLQLYRLTKPFEQSAEALHDALQEGAFRHCGALEYNTMGWYPPLGGEDAPLVHAANGCLMLCARREERILPSAVIKEAVDERVEKIRADEGRDPGRRERREMRDDIEQELLPKAFTRSNRLYAYIDPRKHWLVVDASSAKRAEELITLLRETLGTLPVRPLKVEHAPADLFTRWVHGDLDSGLFQLGDECEMRSPLEGGAIVRCRHQELASEEIRTHLDAGKQVVKLALEWNERISFLLDEELAIKRLRFPDLMLEEAAESGAEDEAARFDAEFALMTLELDRFLTSLVETFGGIEEPS
ncbi:MAG TPA: recombination-associated protein RdgC [Chromatiales bacterium]|nr:recombination-associated protein RdgC [Chromatiales bacterium]